MPDGFSIRALHVIAGVAARCGGPSQAVFEMCRALQEEGIEPLIATTDADGRGRLPVELARPVTYQGVRVIFFPRQWSEGFKYSHPLACWLKTNVKSFDLVHVHGVFSHSSLAAARFCRQYGVPYLVRPLGSLDPWSLKQKRLRKRLLWHLGVKNMLREAVAIHYTTVAERRLAEGPLGLQSGVVIPLGINSNQLLNSSPTQAYIGQLYPSIGKDPYVLVLSRLHPKKGLELLVDAFLDLIRQEEFQRWRLVVAGDGDASYVVGLKRFVRRRGGDGRVLFTGWLEGPEKIATLQGAALLALPSYQENFGLSVVEALAYGVPVLISTQVNLAEEILAAGAGWVVSLQREALLRGLAKALGEEGERAARGSAGRELVLSRFTWSAVTTRLTQLYSSVVKQPPQSEL